MSLTRSTPVAVLSMLAPFYEEVDGLEPVVLRLPIDIASPRVCRLWRVLGEASSGEMLSPDA